MAVWHPFGFSSSARRRTVPHAPALPSLQSASDTTGDGAATTETAATSAAAASGGVGVDNSAADTTQESSATTTEALFCDPCDKTFPNQRALQQHLKTHTKCTECDFQATQSVVLEHVTSAHSTGSRWTYDAADIEKWRADRRKRYPTDTNMRKRQREEAARVDRGQVATTPLYRVGKGHYRDGKRRKTTAEGGSATSVTDPHVPLQQTHSEEGNSAVETSVSTPAAPASGGLAGLVTYSSSSEDEDEESANAAARDATHQGSHPPSDDGSGDEAPVEASSVAPPPMRVVVPPETADHINAHGGGGVPKESSENMLGVLERQMEDPLNKLKAGKFKTSLLERLLAKEIRRERNIVLQCIRHIVRCNFFE
eukprot:m.26694 g.26694  ORF g.26694 m.26694 type:complete len:369 (+) comp4338_c0_seq1:145-1251(+)